MEENQIADGDFEAAIRYLDGHRDEDAEDAYFEVERIALASELTDGLRMLERLAAGVDPQRLGDFGAGFLETFLRDRGAENPALIEETIAGNGRLIEALRGVNSLAIPFELAIRLSPLVHSAG